MTENATLEKVQKNNSPKYPKVVLGSHGRLVKQNFFLELKIRIY